MTERQKVEREIAYFQSAWDNASAQQDIFTESDDEYQRFEVVLEICDKALDGMGRYLMLLEKQEKQEHAKNTNVLTNADRIRVMSVEEMAKARIHGDVALADDFDENGYPAGDHHVPVFFTSDYDCFSSMEEAMQHEIAWLNSPAEGSET